MNYVAAALSVVNILLFLSLSSKAQHPPALLKTFLKAGFTKFFRYKHIFKYIFHLCLAVIGLRKAPLCGTSKPVLHPSLPLLQTWLRNKVALQTIDRGDVGTCTAWHQARRANQFSATAHITSFNSACFNLGLQQVLSPLFTFSLIRYLYSSLSLKVWS